MLMSSVTLDSDLLDCDMADQDPFVVALKALCAREGGYRAVAQHANLSAANLSQILAGVTLPSGNPRGVGPAIRKALNESYPDWLSARSDAPTVPAAVVHGLIKDDDLARALDKIADAYRAADQEARNAFAPMFLLLANHPESGGISAQTIAKLLRRTSPTHVPSDDSATGSDGETRLPGRGNSDGQRDSVPQDKRQAGRG